MAPELLTPKASSMWWPFTLRVVKWKWSVALCVSAAAASTVSAITTRSRYRTDSIGSLIYLLVDEIVNKSARYLILQRCANHTIENSRDGVGVMVLWPRTRARQPGLGLHPSGRLA